MLHFFWATLYRQWGQTTCQWVQVLWLGFELRASGIRVQISYPLSHNSANYKIAKIKPLQIRQSTCSPKSRKYLYAKYMAHTAHQGKEIRNLSQWIALVHGENEKIYFCFVNAEFYRVVYWTINALLIIRSKMLPFSENNQNIQMFGVPPNTLPQVMYIMIILPLGNITLQYMYMSFKTIAGRSDGVFLWFPALSEDQEFFFLNSPNRSCGFNSSLRTKIMAD